LALVIPNVGESVMLQNLLNKTAPQNMVLKLYTNNVTPGPTDTAGTYTEAAGSGYAALTLTGSSWGMSAGNPTIAAYAQQTWTFTGVVGNIYGYFVVQATSGILMWAEKFSDGPYNIQNNGDQVKVTPTLDLT
jgi:hypothetical protein